MISPALPRSLWWLALVCSTASARVATYVENPSQPADPDEIAIGFPVPQPRDQSAPFAGFRSLNGLTLRSAELVQQPTGPRRSVATVSPGGREIEMLCFGPAEQPLQVLQTGGIHAREWAAPEAVMGLAEAFTLERDQPLIAWVADNVPFCLVPVLNPDGFAQTQREPLNTRICEAPEESDAAPDCNAPASYPRDGRMRRKNLRDTDGSLATAVDALNGVDLNRNNNPYWATSTASGQSTNDPRGIVYHGPAATSEAEVAWLDTLVANAAPDQFRLFVDTHSFSRLFYWNCTGERPLDTTTNTWIERFRLAARTAYVNAPTGNPQTGSGCGRYGIGATDELFAFNAGAPSFTLELEPGYTDGAAEYGGTGVSHDGFILPETIVPAMRQDVIQMMVLAYSMTAGPAWVKQVRVSRADTTVYEGRWTDAGPTRTLQTTTDASLIPGDTVSIAIDFDRPMRWLDDRIVRTYPGQPQALNPTLRLRAGGQSWPLESNTGSWTQPENGYLTQRFELSAVVPADWDNGTSLQLEISTGDNATFALDGNPTTIPRWSDGHFENAEPGTDRCHLLVAVGDDTASCSDGKKRGSGGGSNVLLLVALAALRRKTHVRALPRP